MSHSPSNPATWEEIEFSESLLLHCMVEESASLASSILQRLCSIGSSKSAEDVELYDMMESAGIVLVQSLKDLGRTSELFKELKACFGSVAAIPVQVFLTGACFQMSEGYSSGLRAVFEEFLGIWKYVDGQSYVLFNLESQSSSPEGYVGCSVLGVEKYLEVAEVYAITLLGMVFRDIDLATAWVEKADLPEEKRQEMLRKLRSLCDPKVSNSSVGPGTPELEESRGLAISGINSAISGSEGFSRAAQASNTRNGDHTKSTILSASHHGYVLKRVELCFWWFRKVTLKFGNARLALTQGRIILWSSFVIFIYFLIRRKGFVLKRMVSKQASSLKKALIDTWQLAFSFQVNPLAAVQPRPVASHGGGM